MKPENCGECEFRDWRGLKMKCKKGHKPNFYMPTIYQIMNPTDTDWGYKRRCKDYQEKLPEEHTRSVMKSVK